MTMTLQAAVKTARDYLTEALPELAAAQIQLDELEVPPNGSKWSFTFVGFLPPATDAWKDLLRARRTAKIVEIDPATGDLLAVKNVAA